MKQFKIIEPLSNFQIIELCKKLKITNFRGCFMRDELLGMKRTANESMILNLDDNSGRGTHWTCLFIKNSEAYYFDPFGMPMTQKLETYLEGIPTYYSSFSIVYRLQMKLFVAIIVFLCYGDLVSVLVSTIILLE